MGRPERGWIVDPAKSAWADRARTAFRLYNVRPIVITETVGLEVSDAISERNRHVGAILLSGRSLSTV